MSTVNIIAVAPVAFAADCNRVLEAMGYGPNSLGVKASTAPNQPFGATSTHLFMSAQSVSLAYQAQLLAAGGGDLPPLAEGVMWGEDGVISALVATAAMAQLQVFTASENVTPADQVTAALGALGLYQHLPPADV